MESLLVQFGQEEDQRLAATMPPCRELEKRQKKTAEFQAKRQADPKTCGPGSLVDVLAQQAQAREDVVRQQVQDCQTRQQRARAARRGLSRDYHPVRP